MTIKWLTLPLTSLLKAEWNYKINNDKLKEKLKKNIKKNGILENLVIRQIGDKYEIINGNHRYDAYKELNITECMCADVGVISDEQAYKTAIELNETSFPNDEILLAKLMKKIFKVNTVEIMAETLPYEPNEIQDYIDTNDFWETYKKEDIPMLKPLDDSTDLEVKKKHFFKPATQEHFDAIIKYFAKKDTMVLNTQKLLKLIDYGEEEKETEIKITQKA